MRIRRALLASLAVMAVLAPAVPARAGGSWLEPDHHAYAVGDPATFRGRFDLSGAYEGRLADGPYVAYLLPENRWLAPGRVPTSAIRLGEIRIVTSEGSYPTRATVTFEVPEVPTGWYRVGYCNDPCTVDGIGDLIGSDRFVVAPTRSEGRTLARIERLETRIAVVRERVATRARGEIERLENRLAHRTDLLAISRGRLSELGAPEVIPQETPIRQPSVTWWIAVLACGIGLVFGLAIGRRRVRPEIVVPDTIPDDLEQRPLTRLSR